MSEGAPGPAGPSGDPTLVAWFRQDVRRDVWRAWRRAFLLVCLAMILLGLPMGFGSPAGLQIFGWIVGGLCLLSGPTYLMARLQRILGPDIYLAIHQDGLRWHHPDGERLAAWERIDRIEARPDALVITLEEGPPVILRTAFTGIAREPLAQYLRELQRQALMGLRLRPPPRA